LMEAVFTGSNSQLQLTGFPRLLSERPQAK